MTTESPFLDKDGCMNGYGRDVYKTMKVFINTKNFAECNFPEFKKIAASLAEKYEADKLPIFYREKLCSIVIAVEEVFEFMIELLQLGPDEGDLSFFMFQVIFSYDVKALRVLIRRGWKLEWVYLGKYCPICICLWQTRENSLDMLRALLDLGVAPKDKTLDDVIDWLNLNIRNVEQVYSPGSNNPRLQDGMRYEVMKLAEMARKAIGILEQYKVPFPDVKVAEGAIK